MMNNKIPLAILAVSAAFLAAYRAIACTLSTNMDSIIFVGWRPAGGLVGYCVGEGPEILLVPGLLAIAIWLLLQKGKRASSD